MPREESYTIAEPGAGDVTDGSVDYYPMDWEIVRRARASGVPSAPSKITVFSLRNSKKFICSPF